MLKRTVLVLTLVAALGRSSAAGRGCFGTTPTADVDQAAADRAGRGRPAARGARSGRHHAGTTTAP